MKNIRFSSGPLGILVALVCSGLLLSSLPVRAHGGGGDPSAENEAKRAVAVEACGRLPLYFIENRGQMDEKVKFYEKSQGHSIFFSSDTISFSFARRAGKLDLKSEPVRTNLDEQGLREPNIITLNFLGASKGAEIAAEERQRGRVNYFVGSNPKEWKTDIPTYRSVVYREAYPGIDVRFYGTDRQMEYDVVVKSGADPSLVKFQYNGLDGLDVTAEGNLVIKLTDGSVLVHKKPVIYQDIDGKRVAREGAFKVFDSDAKARSSVCGFELAAYDKERPLIIDPVLVFSTYLGGLDGDYGWGIAVDTLGNAYVTGTTQSTNFPTENPEYPAKGNQYDVFVTKFDTSGSFLIYSTYIGGSGYDYGFGVAVDGFGNAYATGSTDSTDFPTASPLQAANGGQTDAFVVKLSGEGALLYSTYLGGSGRDIGYALAVDGSDCAYITGETDSANFPTTIPLQPALGGAKDAFVTKLDATGSSRAYSTYLGGGLSDTGYGITVDGYGNVFVTGATVSDDFPTSSPLQIDIGGQYDAFLAKIDATGAPLVYSTFIGGTGNDYGYGVASDVNGNAYVVGYTESIDFPTAGAFQDVNGGQYDAFVTKVSPAGDSLAYSTYLGGFSDEYGRGIFVDGPGNAYVVGSTSSGDFPTKSPFQTDSGGLHDAFIAKLNPAGSALVYSSYLGGSFDEYGTGIAVDANGDAYVTGYTESFDFPTDKALQDAVGGAGDAFVARISELLAADSITITSPSGGESWQAGSMQTISWTYTGNPGSNVKIELFKAGSVVSTLVASTSIGSSGSGSYYWTIPTGQPPGTDYTIQVTSTSNTSCTDRSNVNFAITLPPANITVTAPNGGESWQAGSTQKITWTYQGNLGTAVKIELLKAGAVVKTISSSASVGSGGTGFYYWRIPTGQTAGIDYRIQITSISLSSCNDKSDADLSVTAVAAKITLTSPNGGEILRGGSTVPIRWTYTGNPGGNVQIDLLQAGVVSSAIIASTSIGGSGTGSYAWTIPAGQAPAADYTVQITSTTDPTKTDTSDSSFNIAAPTLTLISPNGGETWHTGDPVPPTIKWTYTGNPGANVKIDLLKSGSVSATLVASTAIGSNGSGSCTLPVLAQPVGTAYKIRITSLTTATCTDVSNANFTIDTPAITVLTPNGGETWQAGSLQTIRWSYTGNPGAAVKIELLQAGAVVSTLSTSTPIGRGGTGSYTWTIPASQTAGANYTVQVTSTTIGTCNDVSDAQFSISAPTITLISPNGGEVWQAGSSQLIRWTYTGNPGPNVKLELLKGGSVVVTMATSTSLGSGGNGSCSWTVPASQTPGTDYTVKVTSTTTASATYTSAGTFSISAPTISILSPNGGETWQAGTTQAIRWSYTGSPGATVKVELLKAGAVVKTLAASVSIGASGKGSYQWTIPSSQAAGLDYTVQITSLAVTTVVGASAANFTIAAPTLTISSPNGGEIWQAGGQQTIRWTYTGNPGANVKIELFKAGALVKNITTTAPIGNGANGSYIWTVPSTQIAGTDYTVKITSTTTATCTSTSAGQFTINAPLLTLTAPNGGESWQAGSTQTLRWTYTGNPGSFVRLDLLKAGAVVRTITTNTSIGSTQGGSYSWVIPATQTVGSDYTVRVTSTSTATCTDTSDNNFAITGSPSTLTVTSPNGGESWQAGSIQKIRWSYTGNPGPYVKIELLKGGSAVRVITTNGSLGSAGVGSYTWTIPNNQAAGPDYMVRVTSTTNTNCTATSANVFSITSSAGSSITVTSPNGGEAWQIGSAQTISWTYTGSPGATVKIELLQAGSVVSTLSSGTSLGSSGSGSYAWTIPSSQTAGTDYTIRISSTSTSYSDTSNTTFTLY